MAKRTNILIARVSFVTLIDGKRVAVHRGRTTAHANHPVVRGREQHFRPLVVDYAVDEQEDEEGEPAPPKKRSPGRPKKQAEEKPEESGAGTTEQTDIEDQKESE